MKNFAENLDGKVLDSSTVVYERLAAGEYAVGITYEEAALKHEREVQALMGELRAKRHPIAFHHGAERQVG